MKDGGSDGFINPFHRNETGHLLELISSNEQWNIWGSGRGCYWKFLLQYSTVIFRGMQNVLNLDHFKFKTIHLDFKMSCFKEKQLFQVWNRLFPLEVFWIWNRMFYFPEQRCFLLETFPQWFRAAYSALENSSFALVAGCFQFKPEWISSTLHTSNFYFYSLCIIYHSSKTSIFFLCSVDYWEKGRKILPEVE